MDRFLKWFPLFFLVVLIVMAAAAYWYVTPQRLKAIVQPYLSLALKRDVTFDRINWRLSEGVVISGLRVAGLGWSRSLIDRRAGTGAGVAERVVFRRGMVGRVGAGRCGCCCG